MKRLTIYDVARQARVSPMTVSLALRPHCGRSRMTAGTRNRILETARRLNFHPHPGAKGLRTGRTHHIGFYINRADYLNLTYVSWHRLITALQSKLWEFGYRLGFYYFDPQRPEGFKEFLVPHRFVDAIVVQGRNLSPAETDEIRSSGMRTISLYEKLEGLNSFTVDEWGAGCAAADYLHQCGHRRVAVLAHRLNVDRWDGRTLGFLQRSKALGMETPASAQFFSEDANPVGAERQIGRELFKKFLRRRTSIRCLYVPSDYLAFGIVEMMDERRLRLGQDLSLLSYDNLEGAGCAPWKTPRLTSFEAPYTDIGAKAAEFLTEQTGPNGTVQHAFQPKLVVRNSVAQVHHRSHFNSKPVLPNRGGGS